MEKTIDTNEINNDSVLQEHDKQQEKVTSLDILWRQAFGELEQWENHANFRDEVFLKEANYFAESVKRNQGNLKEVVEQFHNEFIVWEKMVREEFLMSTTTLQHVFPKISYEEMNQQIDNIQSKTTNILNTPLQMIINNQLMDKYINMIEQYIALRQNGRRQYIKTIRQAANIIYEGQKGFIDIFTGQIKSLMFPLNKFMEKPEETTKS